MPGKHTASWLTKNSTSSSSTCVMWNSSCADMLYAFLALILNINTNCQLSVKEAHSMYAQTAADASVYSANCVQGWQCIASGQKPGSPANGRRMQRLRINTGTCYPCCHSHSWHTAASTCLLSPWLTIALATAAITSDSAERELQSVQGHQRGPHQPG